jgi:Domain of unknown function (DUF4440)
MLGRSFMRVATVAAATLSIAGAFVRAQPAAEEPRTIVQRALDGLANRDAAALEGIFDTAARLVIVAARNGSSVATAVPVKSIIDGLQAPGPRRREELRNDKTVVAGDLATVTGDYVFFYDDTLHHCGTSMWDLVRTDGRWRIVQIRETDRRTGCTP